MTYISWYHENLPRIFGALSFMINPIFIYLVFTKSRSQMGSYKYLLIIFAIFDILYSISDITAPFIITGNKNGFVIFLTNRLIFENMQLTQYLMSNRCGFISISYALLIINFVYRYIALFNPEKLPLFFKSTGIIASFILLLAHYTSWFAICQTCLAGNDEVRELIRDGLMKDFGANSTGLPVLSAMYYGASDDIKLRSFVGIFLLTILSFYALTVYFVLGYKIIHKISVIQESGNLSKNSVRLQKQLFLTLIIQTCIPIFASFLPTVFSWYAPIIGLSIEWWNMNVVTVALATFPFIDPLAVIYLIPSYRNAVLRRKGLKIDDTSSAHPRRRLQLMNYVHSRFSNY